MFLEDRGKEMTYNDFDTQTDEFLDRPQTPFFIPWKSGPDAFTQVIYRHIIGVFVEQN